MSEGEGVVGATTREFKAHPALIIGGVVAIAAVLWFASSRKAATPASFNFSYGPSDAQVQAGTALAIAQQADQTQVSLAQTQATATGAALSSYFDYLTGATTDTNATNLAAARISADTTTAVAGINAQTAQVQANDTYALGVSNNATTVQGFAYGVQADTIAAGVDYNRLQAANYQAGVASYTSTFNKSQDANISYNNDQTALGLAMLNR